MSGTAAKTATASAKSKAKTKPLSDQEIQSTYTRFQNELQSIAGKIGELETEAEEHDLVLGTLNDALAQDPARKCFRLIGGVLVERTVGDVVPDLKTNRDGIKAFVENLATQYKSKEEEFVTFTRDYDIRPVRS
ncbi:Prefoldin [Sistotremastrum niveocremeum HHB9708]|uniref:Prefoldin n=2 Tax=Sistotremastraceae TaxID=3402574 RepID=A0A164VFP3_9AGAM|nr:Prefoldin [Sistotremastrum niveocremeum HHB9708]KZT35577.1 Prefoldin [Sistotremastrum suecicum HHB10207 ss-3]